MDRPKYLRDEHLDYLDELRESGAVNMYGARGHLWREFCGEITDTQAKHILHYWMHTFGERHP